MDTHVKVLAALNICLGILCLLGALVVMVIFGGLMIGASSDPDAAGAVPLFGVIGTIAVFATLLLALPAIIVGLGLWRFRPWARIAGIVVAILSLPGFPFATLLGVYGLWVLLNKETEPLFSHQPGTIPTAG